MPSRRSTAQFNAPLTAYAYGLMQDRLATFALANLICPIVQVGAATGTFKIFDDRNAFSAPETARALGGPRTRITHDAADGTYACKPQGIEIGLDDFEADLGGPNMPADKQAQLKIRTLTSQKATSYAKRVADFAFANLTPVPQRGNWSNDDIDPIDQLDEQLDAISLDTGTTENKALILSVAEWRALRTNAKVKQRLGLKDNLSLKREMLIDGLLYPVKLEISGVTYTPTKRGQAAAAKARVMAGYALIVHTEPNPTENDPSAFKCFSTSDVLMGDVKEYREEQSSSDIYATDWSEDIKKTGESCARLLVIS